jgi:hypothetical protein
VNKDENNNNKLNLNERTIKIALKKGNISNNNINNIIRNITKKKNLNYVNDSSDHKKINNIIFDADFLKRANYLGNSSINDYYNQNYRIKRPKKYLIIKQIVVNTLIKSSFLLYSLIIIIILMKSY